jgi:hypothetical protein
MLKLHLNIMEILHMSDLYMPIEERRIVILDYAQQYGCRTFVETGTADASTTQAMVPFFDMLYTIEIDEALYIRAFDLFSKQHDKVVCLWGDSSVRLPLLMPKLTGPTIFWLDGHYCGGATRGELDSPVESELVTVLGSAPEGSVILVDDARIFGGMEAEGGDNGECYTGYPEINYVAYLASQAGRNFKVKDDIIRITPHVQDH